MTDTERLTLVGKSLQNMANLMKMEATLHVLTAATYEEAGEITAEVASTTRLLAGFFVDWAERIEDLAKDCVAETVPQA